MTVTQTQTMDVLLPLLTSDVIEAIADRPHESEPRRRARAQAAMRMIEAFEPEDGVEAMLAGQAVLMRTMMLDSVHDASRATMPDDARSHRTQAMALVRAQLSLLKEIRLHRAARPQAEEDRPAHSASAPQPEAKDRVAAPPASLPTTPLAATPPPRPDPVPGPAPMQPATPRAEASGPAAPAVPLRLPSQMPPQTVAGPARPLPAMTGT